MTLFADIVATSRRVADTPGRNAKIDAIAACVRALEHDEVALAVAYLSGETRQGRQGIGYALIRSAQPADVPQRATLSVADVDEALGRIGATTGGGSTAARARLLAQLFERATAAEREFLIRLLLGELRQGALEGLMVEAVAAAADLPVATVRRAAMVAGGIACVATIAMTEGASGLARYSIALMQPVAPMLAQPANDIAGAMAQLGTAALEWKLDGARVQVHKAGDDVRVFTRSLNEVSASVPEIVAAVRTAAARELILDGEAIALRSDGAPHPFQITMRRFGRERDVDAMKASLPLSVQFFDCLLRDGEPLIEQPTSERIRHLAAVLPQSLRIPRLVTGDVGAAEAFLADALAHGHEGVMAKGLDSRYDAGSRGASWLKVKRTHTLDLVVLAAEWGNGRREGWLSNLHLGARDPSNGGFVMLGKTFKGMTDEMLKWQTRELLARETHRDRHVVFVRPELVVEIAFNDLQASPRYPGGLALRFARVKGYRPDKRVDETDTIDVVRAIFEGQIARERTA
jgi:DNA ligase-1